MQFLPFLYSKTIDIPIIDQEEYDKNKLFELFIGEPKLIMQEGDEHKIPDLSELEDEEMKRIIEAGQPTLGKRFVFLSSDTLFYYLLFYYNNLLLFFDSIISLSPL